MLYILVHLLVDVPGLQTQFASCFPAGSRKLLAARLIDKIFVNTESERH